MILAKMAMIILQRYYPNLLKKLRVIRGVNDFYHKNLKNGNDVKD